MLSVYAQADGEEGDVLEGLRRAAAAATAAEFLQAHGHRLLTPDVTAPEVLRQLQHAAEACPACPSGKPVPDRTSTRG